MSCCPNSSSRTHINIQIDREMERVLSWEQKTLMNELAHGMEAAKRLKSQLRSSESSPERNEQLILEVVSSYKKALLMLKLSGQAAHAQPQPGRATPLGLPESPASINGSPTSVDSDAVLMDNGQEQRDNSKKRKLMPRWTEQVRVNPETGLEGPHEDGHNWRKYGQKDILGAKYPRSYYRCTYRNTQNCWATKQVQRSDEDPSLFDVTYRGTHTCIQASHPPPEKLAKPKLEANLEALRSSLTVHTEGLGAAFSFPQASFGPNKIENDAGFCNVFSGYQEPDCYAVAPYQIDTHQNAGRLREPDLGEIISATTSASNSPMFDADFSLSHFEIAPDFAFGDPEFFS